MTSTFNEAYARLRAVFGRGAAFAIAALLMGVVTFLGLTLQMTITIAPPRIDAPVLEPYVVPPAVTITTPTVITTPQHEFELQSDPLELLPITTAPAHIDLTSPTGAAGPIEITVPHWARRPSNLSSYYPPRALRFERDGLAVLDCIVRASGALDCRVASETPAGWGFGDAALRIAAAHRMIPATRDGTAVEGRYTMRVPFSLAGD